MRCFLLIVSLSLFPSYFGLHLMIAQTTDYSILVLQNIDEDNINHPILNEAILRATNKIRVKKGLNLLELDPYLEHAASLHAEYLSQQNELVHLNYKKKSLKTPSMRVASTGATMSAVGENLARMSIYQLEKNGRFFVDQDGKFIDSDGNQLTTLTYDELATQVTEGWFKSKGHRENLLGDYTHLGLAERQMSTGKEVLTELVFVQNFGKY